MEEKIELTEDELKAQIEEKKKDRANKCFEEMQEVLKKHNCEIVTDNIVIVNGQQIQPCIIAK